MLLTMVYIIFATPYIIAFNLDMNTLSSSNPSQWLAILDLVICGIFCTDMLFNFKTAYMKKTKQANMVFMTKRSDIFFHYMAFWFWLDLVTSIPWEFVIDSESIAGPVSDVQAARVIRILRIWRLVQLIRLMKELSKQNSKNIFDVSLMRCHTLNIASKLTSSSPSLSDDSIYPGSLDEKIMQCTLLPSLLLALSTGLAAPSTGLHHGRTSTKTPGSIIRILSPTRLMAMLQPPMGLDMYIQSTGRQ